MPIEVHRGLSALSVWTRKVTKGYKDVNVEDLSSSWRNGLAFCALIHHFRPDLIDFDSLSKENILHNNRLAFAVAEKHLGIASLLDPEDMFQHEEPDRLSVATYLSQFYEYFEGSKSDRKLSISGEKIGSNESNDKNINKNENRKSLTHPPIPPKRDMRCQKCKLRVYILERIIVEDNVYHKSCYDSLLEENRSVDQKNNNSSLVSDNSINNNVPVIQRLDINNTENNKNYISINSSDINNDSIVSKSIIESNVEINNLQINDNQSLDENTVYLNDIIIDEKQTEIDISKKSESIENHKQNDEIINEINETHLNDNSTDGSIGKINESLKSVTINENVENFYPDDKNPFGDEEEVVETNEEIYPTDKNPFGDEDVDDRQNKVIIKVNKSDASLNPFGEGDDEEEVDMSRDSSANNTPTPKPRKSLNVSDAVSPTNSLQRKKKRAAPTPPMQKSLNQVNSSCSLSSNLTMSEDNSRRDSIISNVSSDLPSSVASSRTPTPLPRVRIQRSSDDLSNNQKAADNNSIVESDSNSKTEANDSDNKNNTFGYWKTKKRPAPPIPAVKRIIKGSIPEIEAELNRIGDELPVIEKKSVELEMILRNRDKNESINSKDDTVMNEFLSTARERCRLARKQKELMYMKREHKLEEIQADIEYQMRVVISKQSAQKTEEDQQKEEELLRRLVEIIEERNDIVENMIRDENKEVEEYQKLVAKVIPIKTNNSSDNKQPKSDTSESVKEKGKKVKDKKKVKEKKEIKEKKEKSDKGEKSVKLNEFKKESKSTFSLGKSTLKRLGMKSSEHKLDKSEIKTETNSSKS